LNSGLTLYPLSHTSSPFCSAYFGDGVLQTFCLAWAGTTILLITASHVAGITGVSHCARLVSAAPEDPSLSPSSRTFPAIRPGPLGAATMGSRHHLSPWARGMNQIGCFGLQSWCGNRAGTVEHPELGRLSPETVWEDRGARWNSQGKETEAMFVCWEESISCLE
jgi:hypothetical protein